MSARKLPETSAQPAEPAREQGVPVAGSPGLVAERWIPGDGSPGPAAERRVPVAGSLGLVAERRVPGDGDGSPGPAAEPGVPGGRLPGRAADQIALRGLRARGYHGVYDRERLDGQDFVVDAVLGLDTRPAAAADDLAQTVDYGSLAARLAAIVSGEPARLIETLAQRLANACLAEPAVTEVEITVHKPQAPVPFPFDDVAVTISRRRT